MMTPEECKAYNRERNAARRANFGPSMCSSHKLSRPCATCCAYHKSYRDSGRKKKYVNNPDGRVTFCEKCVSEKFVNQQCLACRGAYSKRYRLQNGSRRKAYRKAFWRANKERLSEDNKKRYWSNAEKRKADNRLYHKTNRDACNVRQGRRRAHRLAASGSHTVAEWQAITVKYGGKCAICKQKGRLTKDHIIPLSRGGTDFAFNLQPLCMSCNSAKKARIETGTQHSLFDQVR